MIYKTLFSIVSQNLSSENRRIRKIFDVPYRPVVFNLEDFVFEFLYRPDEDNEYDDEGGFIRCAVFKDNEEVFFFECITEGLPEDRAVSYFLSKMKHFLFHLKEREDA